jgi:cytochrome c
MKMRNTKYILDIALVGLALSVLVPCSALAQGDTSRGKQLYVECAACHTFNNDDDELGPGLQGLFGRQAGALEDYYYSPVLSNSGVVWNADTLNAFIADPQAAVPLNRMPYSGLPDAQDRADLIEYLRDASE